ncbi:hypothetical protein SI65_09130 [Aspergillus cristatus]|uniref:Aldehyde dehydrogenase domain-containing protein n=1 Tax=Aspergillus cristatus TaxID=573508 RepID=A0A1E3B3L4_ASPCR|nr:hypothetical protein SI65_09130 [Aspergillus cristatus]
MSTTAEIETRLFIDGEFVPSSDGAKFDLHSPFTGELVAQVHEAKAVDVDGAVESGKKAFPAWAAMDGTDIYSYQCIPDSEVWS